MADPRNFDELYNGERSFIIGGQTFHWRPLHWREWGELIDRRAADEAEKQRDRKERIQVLVGEGKSEIEAEDILDEEESVVANFNEVIDRATTYVEEGEVPAFKAVLEDKSKRISMAQLNELMVWLQGVQTPDRPTETPSASSSGPGTSGVTSPAA